MSIVGRLRVILGLDNDEFRRNLRRGQADLRVFARVAGAAVAGVAAAGAGTISVLARQSLEIVDAQSKLATSLQTTTASVQIMGRAAELSGVTFSGMEQGAKDLQRRLSQVAATGAGPAKEALDRLGLSATELLALPLDQRIATINARMTQMVPAAERAALAGKLFGEEGALAISRIDAAAIARSNEELRRFGVLVSEVDTKKIADANDAMGQMGLVARGIGNQFAVAVAPALQRMADSLAAIFEVGSPVSRVLGFIAENLDKIATVAAVAAAAIGIRYAGALALAAARAVIAAAATGSLSGALGVLGGAIVKTGIGALIVGLGLAVDYIGKLARAAGGLGAVFGLLKDVAVEVVTQIGAGFEALGHYLVAVAAQVAEAFLNAFATMVEAAARAGAAIRRFLDPAGSMAADVMVGAGVAEGATFAQGIRGMAAGLGATTTKRSGMAKDAFAVATSPLESVQVLRDLSQSMDDAGASGEAAADGFAAAAEAAADLGGDGSGSGGGGAAGAAAKGLEAVGVEAQSLGDVLRDSVVSGMESVADAFGDFVARGFKDFGGFVDAIKSAFRDLISTLVSTALQNRIVIPIQTALFGGGGGAAVAQGGGGLLSGLFGGGGAAASGGLVGGLTSTLGATFGAGGGAGGLFSIGANAAAAGGGLMATVGAALPVIGLGIGLIGGLFGLFRRKPIISSKDFAAIQTGLDLTGMELLNTGRAGQRAAAHLKKLAGGVDEFTSLTEGYFNAYFTDAEKVSRATESMRSAFADLGYAMPTSMMELRGWIEALDLTDKEQRKTYVSLLKLAEPFAEIQGGLQGGMTGSAAFGEDVFRSDLEARLAAAAAARGETFSYRQSAGGVADIAALRQIGTTTGNDAQAAALKTAQEITILRQLWEGYELIGFPTRAVSEAAT